MKDGQTILKFAIQLNASADC